MGPEEWSNLKNLHAEGEILFEITFEDSNTELQLLFEIL